MYRFVKELRLKDLISGGKTLDDVILEPKTEEEIRILVESEMDEEEEDEEEEDEEEDEEEEEEEEEDEEEEEEDDKLNLENLDMAAVINNLEPIPYRIDVLVSFGINPITMLDNVPVFIIEVVNKGIKLYNAYKAHSKYWASWYLSYYYIRIMNLTTTTHEGGVSPTHSLQPSIYVQSNRNDWAIRICKIIKILVPKNISDGKW